MYVQKTLLSVVAVVFFHCQHNSKQQQHKSHTHLKQAIRIMHACMCINQYMLDISGVLQCIANAFHMHMHMFLKNLETQNHTISRLPKSKILCKNLDMSPKFIGIIYLGGNYLLRQQFTSLKGQPTAGGAISVQKVCFS